MEIRNSCYATKTEFLGFQAQFKTYKGACEKCSSADLEDFSSGQLQEFLDQLVMAEALAIDLVEKMEKIYPAISESKNSEVRFRWIRVGLKVCRESLYFANFRPDTKKLLTMPWQW